MIRKKLAVALTAVTSAALVLLGGTLAWQNTEQSALNEASDIVNPGGRLHDDFNGSNKDVYVENFAQEPIFVRVQLGEFLALTTNKGVNGAEHENIMVGGRDGAGNPQFEPHIFGGYNSSDAYWTWHTGGSTVYMPTFNMNKDSLQADVNGTYLGPDGIVTELPGDDRYTDYVVYEAGQTKPGTEIYDADSNSVDEVGGDFVNLAGYAEDGSVKLLEETHRARPTPNAGFISMSEWLGLVDAAGAYSEESHGGYWVYDSDGWVYWSAAVQPGTATGLLLDEIELCRVMDDSWYYAINVVAQFVTADDIGKNDSSGFYAPDAGPAPSGSAERLLELITGVTLD